MERFGAVMDVNIAFKPIGLSLKQVEDWHLPTRPSKTMSPADRIWARTNPVSAELDAIPPDALRDYVQRNIEAYLPMAEYQRLRDIELAERESLREFVSNWGDWQAEFVS